MRVLITAIYSRVQRVEDVTERSAGSESWGVEKICRPGLAAEIRCLALIQEIQGDARDP